MLVCFYLLLEKLFFSPRVVKMDFVSVIFFINYMKSTVLHVLFNFPPKGFFYRVKSQSQPVFTSQFLF